MPFTKNEINQILARIEPIFEQVLGTYDFNKYPASNYEQFKNTFSAFLNPNDEISNAMLWKWGHWGKENYPQSHRNLIAEIKILWPQYVIFSQEYTAKQTFQWWFSHLNRQTTYITVAYITHLVHHMDDLPIVDQHNFRAMNALLGCLRKPQRIKKKPSNWNDILELKSFMAAINHKLPQRSFSEIDRFLMMYGKNYVAR